MNDFMQFREFQQHEKYIRNEVDGISNRVDEAIGMLRTALSRIDDLIALRIEDIRASSEVSGKVKVMEAKASSLELKVYEIERDIKAVWHKLDRGKDQKLGWWSQVVFIIFTAIATVFAAKLF